MTLERTSSSIPDHNKGDCKVFVFSVNRELNSFGQLMILLYGHISPVTDPAMEVQTKGILATLVNTGFISVSEVFCKIRMGTTSLFIVDKIVICFNVANQRISVNVRIGLYTYCP